MAAPGQIRAAREGAAEVIRFHRPEARNAMTDRMLAKTRVAMLAVLHDPAPGRGGAVRRCGGLLVGRRARDCAAGRCHRRLGLRRVRPDRGALFAVPDPRRGVVACARGWRAAGEGDAVHRPPGRGGRGGGDRAGGRGRARRRRRGAGGRACRGDRGERPPGRRGRQAGGEPRARPVLRGGAGGGRRPLGADVLLRGPRRGPRGLPRPAAAGVPGALRWPRAGMR